MGVAHVCSRDINDFILDYIGKVIIRTTLQHTTETEVHNTEVQKLIRDYYASMHAAIVTAVVIDTEKDNVFIYNDEPRDSMKDDYGAYYCFEKDVGVYEAVYCTSVEAEVDTYDQYIGADLQLPNKDGMKRMARVC